MTRGRHHGILASTLLFGPALCWSLAAIAGLVWTLADRDAWTAIDRHGDPVAGSDSCRSCHPTQWSTWHHSWHRTMTQSAIPAGPASPAAGAEHPLAIARSAATPAEILAPFAGEHLDYGGFRATMTRDLDGRPRVRVEGLDDAGEPIPAGAPVLDVAVVLSVGSHRYQQYVAAVDRGAGSAGSGELWRLPVAWHRAEQRWIHMNGAFVEPEGEFGSLADYERHLSRWNDNCIFCHNTEPAPGTEPAGERFESRVGELGIACEACHGPADAHLERHRGNPFRRLLAGRRLLADRRLPDGSITNPARLDPARESAICGRCHGQRIAKDIVAVLREGDGFVPGDALAPASRPIFADTTIAGVDGLAHGQPFAARFWPDRTPRLSAYEYQGLLLSPCYAEKPGGLGCGHCHAMHGDEPDGQVRAGKAGQGACVTCHAVADLGGASSPGGHGGHGDRGDVDCLGCHMPKTTYGLLEGMISHRITSPDPGAWLGRADQPDACTQCHVDRSRAWAADAMAGLGLRGTAPTRAESPEERLASRVVLDLLGGDPLQRNLAAHAVAQAGATGSPADRLAWLADGLEDEYPSVRWFSWRAMRTLAEQTGDTELLAALATFDYLGPIDERVTAQVRVRDQVGPPALVDWPELRERLFAEREGRGLWIGE